MGRADYWSDFIKLFLSQMGTPARCPSTAILSFSIRNSEGTRPPRARMTFPTWPWMWVLVTGTMALKGGHIFFFLSSYLAGVQVWWLKFKQSLKQEGEARCGSSQNKKGGTQVLREYVAIESALDCCVYVREVHCYLSWAVLSGFSSSCCCTEP